MTTACLIGTLAKGGKKKEAGSGANGKGSVGKGCKVQFRDLLTNLKMLLCAEGASIIAGYASLK